MSRLVRASKRGAGQLRIALREQLRGPDLVVAPGVFDGLSALVAEEAGFAAVYVSGGAVSRSTGLPDVGILTFTEVRERTREIVDSVDLPVIADADTGYGGIFNVMRTVQELEQVGVAALHLEDQELPKRCGHYDDKRVVSSDEMCTRIRAALDARRDENLVIIARTDAGAVEGFDAALSRGAMYAEAGADMVFVEAPSTREEIAAISRLPFPLVLNMFAGGKTPTMPAAEVAALGFRLMIVPSDLQRAALFGMRAAAQALRTEGSTASIADRMTSFDDRDRLVGLPAFAQLEAEYSSYSAQRTSVEGADIDAAEGSHGHP